MTLLAANPYVKLKKHKRLGARLVEIRRADFLICNKRRRPNSTIRPTLANQYAEKFSPNPYRRLDYTYEDKTPGQPIMRFADPAVWREQNSRRLLNAWRDSKQFPPSKNHQNAESSFV